MILRYNVSLQICIKKFGPDRVEEEAKDLFKIKKYMTGKTEIRIHSR